MSKYKQHVEALFKKNSIAVVKEQPYLDEKLFYFDAGAQGAVYLTEHDTIVKEMHLGQYEALPMYTFMAIAEVNALRTLKGTGITPNFFRAWACYMPGRPPKKDYLTPGEYIDGEDIRSLTGWYKMSIEMEYIDGAESLSADNLTDEVLLDMLNKLAQMNLVHHIYSNDLHPSNILVKDDEVYFIDFGLAFVTHIRKHHGEVEKYIQTYDLIELFNTALMTDVYPQNDLLDIFLPFFRLYQSHGSVDQFKELVYKHKDIFLELSNRKVSFLPYAGIPTSVIYKGNFQTRNKRLVLTTIKKGYRTKTRK